VNTAAADTVWHDYCRRINEGFIADAAAAMRTIPLAELTAAVEVLHAVRTRGSRVYVLGNGGSATTASHMVCDLTKTAQRVFDPALRAFSLVDGTAVLTAYANDVSYADVFACQLKTNAEPGDVLVAISASGRSPNVLAALHAARELGLYSIGMLGGNGGAAVDLVDLALIVDSTDVGIIETAHLGIVHALSAALGAPGPEMV
jgi:D-sedoheptulose 7-phosphate isomerase